MALMLGGKKGGGNIGIPGGELGALGGGGGGLGGLNPQDPGGIFAPPPLPGLPSDPLAMPPMPSPPDPGGIDVGSVIAQGSGGGGPMDFGSYAEWMKAQQAMNAAKEGPQPGELGGGPGAGKGNIFNVGSGLPFGASGATFGPSRIGTGGGGGGGGGGGSLGGGAGFRTGSFGGVSERQQRQEYLEDLKQARTLDLPDEAVSGVNRLVEEYNRAFGEAKGANEARYQELLGIAGETTGQRAADIRAGGIEERSDLEQGLARTGLANTTVSPTLTAGSRRREEESLNRLADQMQGTKLGIIERREDQYPDASSLQASLSALGSGYGGPGVSALFGALGNVRQF